MIAQVFDCRQVFRVILVLDTMGITSTEGTVR